MKQLLFGLCSVAFLSACAMSSIVPYQVSSTPPGAKIYLNHALIGTAPVQIELTCYKHWACPAGASCSWEFHDDVDEVTAYPAEDKSGPSQTKHVNSCQEKEQPGYINFDFGPDSVATLQNADVKLDQKQNRISR